MNALALIEDRSNGRETWRRSIQTRTLRGGSLNVIPSEMVRDLLLPLLEQVAGGLSAEQSYNTAADPIHGARSVAAARWAHITGGTEEAADRALYRILSCESITTPAAAVDELLLALNDTKVEETDLPELPAGYPAAQEMVELHREFVDPDTDPDLASSLHHFSLGFCAAFVEDKHLARAAKVKSGRGKSKAASQRDETALVAA